MGNVCDTGKGGTLQPISKEDLVKHLNVPLDQAYHYRKFKPGLVACPGIILVEPPEWLVKEDPSASYALPLRSVTADVTIRESIAYIKME